MTFYNRLIAANQQRFELRKAEIEQMQEVIKAAEPIIMQLEEMLETGLRLDAVLPTYFSATRALHISMNIYHTSDCALHAALVNLGFREIERIKLTAGLFDYVILGKDGLNFTVSTTPGFLREISEVKPTFRRRKSDEVTA